jgi:hypothetical protein
MKFASMLFCGIVAFALPLHASVVLGFIGTESGVPVAGEEDVVIYNLTGPVWGCSTSAGTPVCTAVTFDNVVLTVDGIALNLGNIGPGFIETYTVPGGTFADGTIDSLALSATLSNTVLMDDLGNTVDVASSILLTGIATDGSLQDIAAQLASSSIPEPSSMALLLGLCIAGICAAVRFKGSLS